MLSTAFYTFHGIDFFFLYVHFLPCTFLLTIHFFCCFHTFLKYRIWLYFSCTLFCVQNELICFLPPQFGQRKLIMPNLCLENSEKGIAFTGM